MHIKHETAQKKRQQQQQHTNPLALDSNFLSFRFAFHTHFQMNAIHSINPAILNVHWTNVCSGYMYLIAIAMSKHDVNASELLQIQKVFAVSSWLKKEEEEEEETNTNTRTNKFSAVEIMLFSLFAIVFFFYFYFGLRCISGLMTANHWCCVLSPIYYLFIYSTDVRFILKQ